jgi:uncharacterized protein (DUF488 family)
MMSVVFTVGYEATDIDRFVKTLKVVGVKKLADIRAVAVSRKVGFSKNKLASRLSKEGIEYLHLMALGDPKPGRDAARAGKYELFRTIYSNHIETSVAQQSLRELAELVRSSPTCLLCFERDPLTCHRTIVAQEIAKETNFQIWNLFADDPEHYVRHARKLPSFHSGEGLTAA